MPVDYSARPPLGRIARWSWLTKELAFSHGSHYSLPDILHPWDDSFLPLMPAYRAQGKNCTSEGCEPALSQPVMIDFFSGEVKNETGNDSIDTPR